MVDDASDVAPAHEPLSDGIYERLITVALEAELDRLGSVGRKIERTCVDSAEAPAVLAQFIGELVRRRLEAFPHDEDRTSRQVALVNQLLALLAEHRSDPLVEGPEQLFEVIRAGGDLGELASTPRPVIAFGATDVLLGDRGEHSARDVIARELPSADRIDLICSFLKWSGYRLLRDAIRSHIVERRRPLRVLTTTYVGVTERRVLDDLRELGAEVRVSYEHQRTRLHAKAWLFQRHEGLSTAIVGSSNVTHSALVDGLEWNVRLSERATPDAVRKLAATFESYWNGDEFEPYASERDAETFDRAIAAARGDGPASTLRLLVELRPHSFQQEMLDRLEAERRIHDRHRNLVVAATGTGKTVVAALDFARLHREHRDWRLLFVAHRREILEQARDTYRHALGDRDFGDVLGDGETPREGRSVFAMIQSLGHERLQKLDPEAYQTVVVDEFHHASARTYRELLDHVRPRELLGLTATPERADGVRTQDEFFGGRIAAELRLWDALDRGLLVPFHYFGVADGTDLRSLQWSGGYERAELETLYTGNDVRLRAVLRAVNDYVPDPGRMRALGFCAGVAHARWMAERFEAQGLPAVALSGESSHEERERALGELRRSGGRLRAIFTADLFNEGVDVPEADVVLFLRPTDSHVLFQQQLGRGLRRAPGSGKSCLTVLDFVGQQHRRFRMHQRLGVICGAQTRRDVETAVEAGLSILPPGCAMHLEQQAREAILQNLHQAIGADVRSLEADLRALGPTTTLSGFLSRTGADLADVHRGGRSFSALRRRVGFETRRESAPEQRLREGLGRLLHLDDVPRLRWLLGVLTSSGRAAEQLASAELTRWQMLEVLLTGAASGGAAGVDTLRAELDECVVVREELRELAQLLLDRLDRTSFDLMEIPGVPLQVHASYGTREALAALGQGGLARIDQGVFHVPDLRCDAFFITSAKSEKDYSPSTMYEDRAISPLLFHWQSQSTTPSTSNTARRYIEHAARGHNILLFVRERRVVRGVTQPYAFLGAADYVSHEGSRPVSILWRLRRPMPPAVYRQAAMVGATA